MDVNKKVVQCRKYPITYTLVTKQVKNINMRISSKGEVVVSRLTGDCAVCTNGDIFHFALCVNDFFDVFLTRSVTLKVGLFRNFACGGCPL